jgi:hypothetical protein
LSYFSSSHQFLERRGEEKNSRVVLDFIVVDRERESRGEEEELSFIGGHLISSCFAWHILRERERENGARVGESRPFH